MKMYKIFLLVLLLREVYPSGFVLDSVEFCDETRDYPMKLYITEKKATSDGFQVFDSNFTLPFDTGENTIVKLKLERAVGRNWIHIIKIDGKKGLCNLMNTYVGPVWFELQKAFKMLPNQCPMKKGTYSVTNYKVKVDFPMVKGFTVGKVRATAEVFKKDTNENLICSIVIIHQV